MKSGLIFLTTKYFCLARDGNFNEGLLGCTIMFYEKYKEVFESGNQMPYQKQMQDIRGIKASLNRKNNVFAKNATSILGQQPPGLLAPNINTALRLEPEKGNFQLASAFKGRENNNNNNFGGFYGLSSSMGPVSRPAVRPPPGVNLRDNMTSRADLEADYLAKVNKDVNKNISSALRDAFSWNDDGSANKFRSLRIARKNPSPFDSSQANYQSNLFSKLQRSNIDLIDVKLSNEGW